MITYVYIIRTRNNMNNFFEIDPDTGNWDWIKNLENATMFQTADKATAVQLQKIPPEDNAYIYEIPYSVAQPQSRKKKSIKITKRKNKVKTKCKNKR
jgi:hypothetical protein